MVANLARPPSAGGAVEHFASGHGPWVWPHAKQVALSHAKLCRNHGKACLHGNHIIQSRLLLYSACPSALLPSGSACARTASCTGTTRRSSPLSAKRRRSVSGHRCTFPGGVYVMGHYGLFLAKSSSPVYKLRILASFQGGKVDESKFPTDADVPRKRIYHPVKCEAEYQSEDRGREGV